jgi:lipopolysaccharide transport system ATP-binding protein
MSQPVIRVEGLGKRYRIGQGARHTALRNLIGDVLRAPARLLAGSTNGSQSGRDIVSTTDLGVAKVGVGANNVFNGDANRRGSGFIWALKDVNFEVQQGEVVGLIGRNGAGKSTLLKVLARITRPTEGFAEIRGRIGSLLEVGTGFHGELTGRENVYMSGAILGMPKAEIDRKFDEIVAFSEVERFLDTPLKHYSSGMQMRLAFAVAAHLEPEILLVDEVLAVGDAAFQKKCLGKMGDISRTGRTIIFVSHNMGPVRTLCDTGVLLRDGTIVGFGAIDPLITAYMDDFALRTNSHTVVLAKPPDRCKVWMESVSILCNGQRSAILETGDKMCLEVRFRSREPIKKPIIGYLIRSSRGENAVNANNYFLPSTSYATPVTEGAIICDLGELPLMAGSYSVSFWLCHNPHEQHHVEDILHFTVEEKDIWGNGALPAKSLSCLWWPTQFNYFKN